MNVFFCAPKKIIILLFSGLCFGFYFPVSAQQNDAVLWGSLQIEKKISKHFSIAFFNQYIINQNYAELGAFFFDGSLAYKYNSYFSISANYRFINARNRDNFYRNRQQWYIDLAYIKGYGKFSANLRARYQVQYYGLSLEDNYKSTGIYNRNKLTIRYKLNGYYSVFVSEELFYNLRPIYQLEAYRTFVGLTKQFNLHHKVELSYGIQQQVNLKNKRTDFISGIAYYYRF